MSLKDSALRLLARRDHSRRELLQKLLLRGFEPFEINNLLDKLQEDGLLSEDRFIGSFIRQRRFRGDGPLKICVELQKRGIDRHRIEANEEWLETAWHENAIAVRIKRFGKSEPCDATSYRQQMQYLMQRGFTVDQIKKAFKKQ